MTEHPLDPHLARLLRGAFEASPNGVAVHLLGQGAVVWNQAVEEILGVTADEVRGSTLFDPSWSVARLDGSRVPDHERPVALVLNHERPVRSFHAVVDRPDGARRWLSIDAFRWDQPSGSVAVAVFFRDITHAKELAAQLERSEARRKRVADMASVGLWEYDLVEGDFWYDSTVAALMGLPRSPVDASAEDWARVAHPDDRGRAGRVMTGMIETGVPAEVSYRVVRPDGELRWVFDHVKVLDWEDGVARRIGGVTVDVTPVKAADERVVALLESMTEAYFAVDQEWRFTYLNRQAEQLLGHTPEELLGRVVWEAFTPLIGSSIEAMYRGVMETSVQASGEFFYEPHDRWYEITAHKVPDGLAAFFRDVSERHQVEAEREALFAAERQARRSAELTRNQLEYATAHDGLTGLPNRTALNAWLDTAMAANDGRFTAVCFLDLDRFKLVNDSHGHVEGDRLLVAVGRRLRSLLARPDDLVARSSGDEFLVGVRGGSEDEILKVARHLLDGLRQPFQVAERAMVVGVCIGVAFASADSSAETLLRDADTALYRAKDEGRNRIVVFDDALRHEIVRRLDLEADLRDALTRNELVLNYQPIYRLDSTTAGAVEALVRWNHPTLGRLPPDRFIPLAEDSGLIVELGEVVLGMAAQVARSWLDQGAGLPGRVWVNASVRQLELPGFPARVLDVGRAAGLPPGAIGIEVTESTLTEDRDFMAAALQELSTGGVPIAIDDFGTGYSSLARLSSYPVDLLKIDKSFVAGLDDGGSRPVVLAIIDMAHALGAQVCAEGVETASQLEALRDLGADWVSGYYLARPVPVDEVPEAAEGGSRLLAETAGGRTAVAPSETPHPKHRPPGRPQDPPADPPPGGFATADTAPASS